MELVSLWSILKTANIAGSRQEINRHDVILKHCYRKLHEELDVYFVSTIVYYTTQNGHCYVKGLDKSEFLT